MSIFKFKQFSVSQQKSAMKIGTDAVLIGAWCPIDNNPTTVLDIGAGTGIISLMLAQRTNAQQIDAVEIEEAAYEECVENFENATWSDRLFCFHAGLDEFVDEPEDEYDLIISNPPFYCEDFKTQNLTRDLARFQDALPFDELVDAADLLLSENGIFAVIIPYKEESHFIELCAAVDLYPIKITRVKGSHTSPIIRSLLAFKRFEIGTLTSDELVVEINRHEYTDDYINLTKDFYLKM
jgi:tRNA1Val (adenine37-N6)-methyltransferase